MSLIDKLNLNSHTDILVLDAPLAFEKDFNVLRGVRISHHLLMAEAVTFALVFVTRKAQLERLWKGVAARTRGDIVLWFAYPKRPSRTSTFDFSRDSDWDVIRRAGFDVVQEISIDANWAALRFRRREFIS